MMTATNVRDNLWLVTGEDGAENYVAVKAGGTAADAIAALEGPTEEQAAALAKVAAQDLAKRECQRRIVAVVSLPTQINMDRARVTMKATDAKMYAAGIGWIEAMRAARVEIVESGDDPMPSESWPAVPAGFAEWAAKY